MHLHIAQLVCDVVKPFGGRALAGALEQLLGDVNSEDAARNGGPRRVTSRLPGAAADVQDTVRGPNAGRRAEPLVVAAQLNVVEVGQRERHGAPACAPALSDD